MELRVIFSTFPDLGAAREAARVLVEERLAACVNLCPAVESVYRWEGKVESASEVLAVIKTTLGRVDALMLRLRALHPYEVPEVVVLPVADALGAYAAWVAAAVEPEIA